MDSAATATVGNRVDSHKAVHDRDGMNLGDEESSSSDLPPPKRTKVTHVQQINESDQKPCNSTQKVTESISSCTSPDKKSGENAITKDKIKAPQDSDCGITEYISTSPGFYGNLKQRYSDFHVHEVSLAGQVAHLTSYDVPDITTFEEPIDQEQASGSAAASTLTASAAAGLNTSKRTLLDLLSAEEFSNLEALAARDQHAATVTTKDGGKGNATDPDGKDEHTNEDAANAYTSVQVACPGAKEQRRILHKAISSFFAGMLESRTAPDQTHIAVQRTGTPSRGKHERGGKKTGAYSHWPLRQYPFCQFVLFKENKSTMDAVGLLQKFLGIRDKNCLDFAGNKDTRAITCQFVTAHKVRAERLIELNKRLYGIRIGNPTYVKTPLSVGRLSGNQFRVVLRSVTANRDDVAATAASLSTHGFINYFGMQRFGTQTVSTADVGKALLRGDFRAAIDLVLQERSGEKSDVARARRWWRENPNKPSEALRKFPKWCTVERKLLTGLAKHARGRGDGGVVDSATSAQLVQAFGALPYHLRTLYLHSYQSLLWNAMASRRVAALGLQPVVGDLVLLPDTPPAPDTAPHAGAGDGNSEQGVHTSAEDTKGIRVKVLAAEDVPKYSITDVVLPMPGYAVMYPHNVVGDWYRQALAEDGITDLVNSFRNKGHKEYSLSGDYRAVVVKPQHLRWELTRYDDVTVSLLPNQRELLDGAAAPGQRQRLARGPAPDDASTVPNTAAPPRDTGAIGHDPHGEDTSGEGTAPESPVGKYGALMLDFQLPSSSYATMLIREFTKSRTDGQFMESLNQV
eukprot:m.516422 g.516422  ORF g.516422 m.516422 type:complete len:801 (+) comp21928_c0_seq4:180-2582(+)